MNSAAAARWLLYIFLFALPFGTRKLLFQFTPGFHEYETAFIYASDVALITFVISVAIRVLRQRYGGKSQIPNSVPSGHLPQGDKSQINYNVQNPNSYTIVPERSRRVTIFFALFLFLAGVSIFFAPSFGLALYSFARLLTAAAFAAAVAYALRRGTVQLRHILGILAVSAVFQSLIALAQFVKQGSVGLWFLGEPALSATAPGIAKFTAEGGKMLRAYGTFPHPNILGAFLVTGLLALSYLWLRNTNDVRIYENKQPRPFRNFVNFSYFVAYTAGIFVIMVGILLTFSRSAWLVAITSSGALLLYGFAYSDLRRRASLLLFALVASGYTLAALFSPFIFSRAQISATEPSVVQRLEYNRLGINLIAGHPFGVGVGNQVMHSVRNGLYEKFGMTEVWQWEPIHNIYLLIGSEIGILGFAAFIFFVGALMANSIWHIVLRPFAISHTLFTAVAMLVALLLLGLVDHFLWTLRPGQLLLWLTIGVVWGIAGMPSKE